MIWRGARFEFRFPRPAVVMGIVNVTPDSFSDGGRFFAVEAAVNQGMRLAEAGAEIIDVGGESTRPNAQPVSEEEELKRVLPVIEQLRARLTIPISIDTMKVSVAERALEAGAAVVNNVADNQADPKMEALVARSGCGYVCMHMQGTPQTMQRSPVYAEVVSEIDQYFGTRLKNLVAAGVKEDQVVLDPGLGFGKTADHNMQLLSHLGDFIHWGRPLLFGVSRKSFLGKLSGAAVDQRLPASLACACWGVQAGAHILRVHDVPETVQAIRMWEEIRQRD